MKLRNLFLILTLAMVFGTGLTSCRGKSAKVVVDTAEKMIGKSKNAARHVDDVVRAGQKLTATTTCTICSGTGITTSHSCYACSGDGYIGENICFTCNGTGRTTKCSYCRGTGKVEKK